MSIFLLDFVIEAYAFKVSRVSNVSEVSETSNFLKKLGWTGGLPVYIYTHVNIHIVYIVIWLK